MTGLPPPAPRPAPLAPARVVVDAARAWLDASVGCASAGDAARGALRRTAGGWRGGAATAATDRARAIRSGAWATSDAGLAGVVAVASFAHALRELGAARAELASRLEDEAASLAHLAALPDSRSDAPALRAAAWSRHRSLLRALEAWDRRRRAAEDDLVSGLATRPGAARHLDLLDQAHRALLRLDGSPAADATRRALRAGDGRAWLLAFDPEAFSGDGSVVIAHGDPATADHVAVVVPGMTTDATTIGEVGAMALALGAAARGTHTPATSRRVRETTSTIAWVGYGAPADADLARGDLRPSDLPDVVRVAGERAAEEGGAELVRFVDGFAGRDVTVVGHSYGSTTAAHAAVDGMDADRLVLLGSPGPGTGVDDADDLHVPTWVVAHDLDPVTWVGGAGPLGVDPAHQDFGAPRLPTDPVAAPHLDELTAFAEVHAGYLRPGSASLDAVASVVAGASPATVPARTTGGAGLAGSWLAGQAAFELTSWR